MNMKMEDQEDKQPSKKKRLDGDMISDTTSFRSMDEPPKDYEVML